MSANKSKKPSLVFALQGQDLPYMRECAEELSQTVGAFCVDSDSWLRVFAIHAAAQRTIPEIAWEVERSLKSLEWLGFTLRDDDVRIGNVDVRDAFRSQECASIAARWLEVPAVADLARAWARTSIERQIVHTPRAVVYGMTAADGVAPKSTYRVYLDDLAERRERESVLTPESLNGVASDSNTQTPAKTSIGALIQEAKAASAPAEPTAQPEPVSGKAPRPITASRTLTFEPSAFGPRFLAARIADIYEADRLLARQASLERKRADSLARTVESVERSLRDDERASALEERRAS